MNDRLEPIMHVVAVVPVETGARVAEALLERRGRIESREHRGDHELIRARVPQSAMLDFWTELAARTGGRGTFSMVLYEYMRSPNAPPQEPEAGVREPRPRAPVRRTGSISLREPEPERESDP